jgi:hypothetical protein
VDKKLSPLMLRVSVLEANERGHVCNCRSGEETRYHTAADLARILSVPCPAHEVRHVGWLLWVPPSTPLRLEDRSLCSCPPSAGRSWREGTRGPLNDEEREQEYGRWEEQLGAEAREQFRRDQVLIKRLLHAYQRNKRRN